MNMISTELLFMLSLLTIDIFAEEIRNEPPRTAAAISEDREPIRLPSQQTSSRRKTACPRGFDLIGGGCYKLSDETQELATSCKSPTCECHIFHGQICCAYCSSKMQAYVNSYDGETQLL